MKFRLSLPAVLATLMAAPVVAAPPAPVPAGGTSLSEVPDSPSTLSLFEVKGSQCQWLRMDPVAQKTAVVASFEGECKGARLSWHKDMSRALVWFDPGWVIPYRGPLFEDIPVGRPREDPTPGATPRLYEVTLASGQVRALPFPEVQGTLDALGYNQQIPTAISLRYLKDGEAQQDSLTLEGKRVPLLGGGGKKVRALVLGYQLQGEGPWKNVAIKGVHQMYDRDIDASDLGELAELGSAAEGVLTPHPGEGEDATDAQQTRLMRLLPGPLAQKAQKGQMPDQGQWFRGTTPSGSAFYAWALSRHGTYTTGHLVLEVKGKPQVAPDLGFTASEFVALRTQGAFVLISGVDVGNNPRLYDARTGKQVFHSDTARSTTFWPLLEKAAP